MITTTLITIRRALDVQLEKFELIVISKIMIIMIILMLMMMIRKQYL